MEKKQLSKINCVLFDMDGVLIDAKEWHYESLNNALKLFGMEISRFDHLVNFDGLPTLKKLEYLSLERKLPPELHDFINELKQKYTMEMVETRCNPKFIHQYALANLKRLGYQLGLCSNSVRRSVEAMLARSALYSHFDVILSNEDVTNPKPDPEIYIKAMEILGMKASECLVIEDNENGIKAAQASGAHLLVVDNVDEVNLRSIAKRIREIEVAS